EIPDSKSGTGSLMEAPPVASLPATTPSARAISRADRASGLALSREWLSGSMPWRLTRPLVGSNANTPHAEAGPRIEPPVSDPMDAAIRRAASAAADPDDDPPAT